MPEPRQKSVDQIASNTFLRNIPKWVQAQWVSAQFWRQSVRNQPIAIIARDKLITYAQALSWNIAARDSSEEDKLKDDIAYYTNYVFGEFDIWLDLMWQDALDLPIGGNTEVVRWPSSATPTVELHGETYKITRPWDRGHVYKIVNIDGGTLTPVNDNKFYMAQTVPGDATRHVFFTRDELVRVVLTPRPEFEVKGYGMPPPQRVYLALNLLYRSDSYYANLLLDTPEAGILDLGDMKESAAKAWVESYKDLMSGINPMKIGVLYEHGTPAKWMPFGRPPSEMSLGETTLRFYRIAAAGYWLTLTDLGIADASQRTLAGTIREQREAKLTGYGMVKEKTANLINKQIIPPWLKFSWAEQDDESMTLTGRARQSNAQALKILVDSGLMTKDEAQAQLIKDGLITVELSLPDEAPPPVQAPPPPPQLPSGESETESPPDDKVPASQGGKGEIGVETVALKSSASPDVVRGGDIAISAVPPGSRFFDQLGIIFKEAFSDIMANASNARLEKLIKLAARRQFNLTSKAILALNQSELNAFAVERSRTWEGHQTSISDMPMVIRSDNESTEAIEKALDDEDWWIINSDTIATAVATVLILAYSEGATVAAEEIWRFAYTEGLVSSPDLILNFDLKNPVTIKTIESEGATLIRHVNDGTKSFIRRAIASGVDEGLSSPAIAERIRGGESLDSILRQGGFTQGVIDRAKAQIGGMLESRIDSIVNTEINRAETNGRVGQWIKMGLKEKAWEHTGPDTPCPVCTANISLGFVPITFKYDSVFGANDTLGPPGHPRTCHCHLAFSEDEIMNNWSVMENRVWGGE
jgi:hypothetical protein